MVLLTYFTDEDLVVELVSKLAESICHVGDPVSEVIHTVFTTDAKRGREEIIRADLIKCFILINQLLLFYLQLNITVSKKALERDGKRKNHKIIKKENI